ITRCASEPLFRIARLIPIIRIWKCFGAQSGRAVAALMKKLSLRREVDFPATAFEFQAEIYVFVPGRIELLIEPTHVFVGLAPDHQSGGSNLINPGDGSRYAVIDCACRNGRT